MDGEGDHLVIMPCYRLPPRGTSCEEWEKPLWVHPFWLVSRTPEQAAANMELKTAETQVVKTMSAGEVDVGRKSFSSFRKITVPVMTTKVPVKKGTALKILGGEKPKKPKVQTVRWDSRTQPGGLRPKKEKRPEEDL